MTPISVAKISAHFRRVGCAKNKVAIAENSDTDVVNFFYTVHAAIGEAIFSWSVNPRGSFVRAADFKENLMGTKLNGHRWGSCVSASRQGSARTAMLLLAVGAALGLAAPAAHATLLVDESFNYPTLANGANMNGITATGVGLSGNYTVGDGHPGSSAGTFIYQTAGLSLGSLSVSGGSVAMQGNAGYNATLSASISATTSASTLYGSYLFNLSSVGGNESAGALIGPISGYDNNSLIEPLAQAYGTASYGVPGGAAALASKSVFAYLSGSDQTAGTTYIAIFQVSGVGASSGTATISEWILNASQYDQFASNGDLTAGALNAAGTGAAATNVLQSGISSGTPSAYPGLTGQYLDFYGAATASATSMTFADYRLSDSSLAEAAPLATTPEPDPLPLMAAGGVGLLMFGRRRAIRRRA